VVKSTVESKHLSFAETVDEFLIQLVIVLQSIIGTGTTKVRHTHSFSLILLFCFPSSKEGFLLEFRTNEIPIAMTMIAVSTKAPKMTIPAKNQT